ncbi:hypothetical protein [Frankia sp. AgB32]|uniref:hypothetical protein n=1 Tax=Frankia sp. AgB32 TaxID=631119 RepID=UPI0020103F73|nr:hypothetical protein [Frankia sp. AgB32]MCK9895580.1 hypothetical protein [Frankia sp. AgB32]
MVGAEQLCALGEVARRISTASQDVGDQIIRLRRRAGRIVHEMALELRPAVREGFALACTQRSDGKGLASFDDIGEIPIRGPPAAVFGNRSVVFWSESST